MVNRTQALVLGFFLMVLASLAVILAAAPKVYDPLGQRLTSLAVSLEGLGCSAMARTLPEDDQAWSEADRGESRPSG